MGKRFGENQTEEKERRSFLKIKIDWGQLATATSRMLKNLGIMEWDKYFQMWALLLILSIALFCLAVRLAPALDPRYTFSGIVGLMLLVFLGTLVEKLVTRRENFYNWPYMDSHTMYKMAGGVERVTVSAEERRGSERRNVNWESLFETLDGTTKGLGYVLDASAGGLGFSCDYALEQGQIVQVFLRPVRKRSVIEVRWPVSTVMDKRLRNGALVEAHI